MSQETLKVLSQAFNERGLQLQQGDVASALENVELSRQFERWAQDAVSSASLMSEDEMIFSNSQGIRTTMSSTAHASGRPLLDMDFEQAIMSLETSTLNLERQCQVLEAQKRALSMPKANSKIDDTSSRSRSGRQTELSQEKARLDFDLVQHLESMESRLRASEKQVDVCVIGFSSSVERMLEKDDRFLGGLQKLLPKLGDLTASESRSGDVDRLCQTMASLSMLEIRSRLDAVYKKGVLAMSDMNEMTEGEQQAEKSDEIVAQTASLQSELDELSGEIDSLVTMAVDHRYRGPISRDLISSEGETDIEQMKWAEYIVLALQFLISRLDELSKHCQQLQAHQRAVKCVSALLERMSTSSQPARGQNRLVTPGLPPIASKGLKPLRLVQANLVESQDPTAATLGYFEIKNSEAEDISSFTKTLDQTLQSRQNRVQTQTRNTEQLLSNHLAQSLDKVNHEVHEISRAAFAYTPFGLVNVVDRELDDSVDRLMQRTDDMSDGIRTLDTSQIASSMRMNVKEAT